MNKKGGMFDIILAIVLSFVLVIFCVIFFYVQNVTSTKLQELAPTIQKSFTNDTNVSLIISDTIGGTTAAYNTLPWITVMLIFGFFFSILVSSFLVKTHPVFFVGYIFISVISIILSAYISNSYMSLYSTAVLTNTWMNFTGANFIFAYLPIWVTVIAFLAGILMYGNLVLDNQY